MTNTFIYNGETIEVVVINAGGGAGGYGSGFGASDVIGRMLISMGQLQLVQKLMPCLQRWKALEALVWKVGFLYSGSWI